MSYTEIYKVKTDGNVEMYDEVHNSHRGAALVWRTMALKYLDANEDNFFERFWWPKNGLRTVWDLYKDERVPIAHRIVMSSTFDNVMVLKENMPQVIDAMRQYAKDFDDPGNIPAEADILEKMLTEEDTYGVCWNQTSVNDGVWDVYIKEDETSRPYNIFKDSKHWFMFKDEE